MAGSMVWRRASVVGRALFVAFTRGEKWFKMRVRGRVKSDEIIVGLD